MPIDLRPIEKPYCDTIPVRSLKGRLVGGTGRCTDAIGRQEPGTLGFRRVLLRCVGIVAAGLLLVFTGAAGASAAVPELFTTIPEDQVSGTGAGRIYNPWAIAANEQTGDLYVADARNARVDVFSAWGEFKLAWGWGVRDGSSELQTCGPAAVPPSTECLSGIEGTHAGQFGVGGGIAVDPANGAVYVVDIPNHRVQKFTVAGEFILTFGGGVDESTGEDVCTIPPQCGPGGEGTAPGEFGGWTFGRYIAVGPTGVVFVGGKDRIQEFEPNGTYKGQFGLPAEGEVKGGTPGGEGQTRALAVDQTGSVYFTFLQDYFGAPQHPEVFKHTGAGWQVFAEAEFPKSLAVDQTGHLFVAVQLENSSATEEILEFGVDGACIICLGTHFGEPVAGSFVSRVEIYGLATDSGCGVADLYATYFSDLQEKSFIQGFGPTPDTTKCPPPHVPPSIASEYAISVGSNEAMVGAQINPHFWADTTYYVQYGTAPCSETSCEGTVLAPGASLGGKAVGKLVSTAGVPLSGLSPGTTYHYRFVAQSSGGGPVYGAERTFTTFPASVGARGVCPNSAFRTGFGALLANCRAYEMVSPVDKNGGDALSVGGTSRFSELNQGSLEGSRFTFSSKSAFAGAESAPGANQYVSSRSSGDGWETTSISPQRANETPAGSATSRGQLAFRAFSDDLCQSWLTEDTGPMLAPGAVPGFINVYRREGCGTVGYQALTTAEPAGQTRGDYQPELQGLAAGGDCAIFRANGNLVGESSPSPTNYEVYERCGETLRLVSRLPSGSASNGNSSVGTAAAGAFINGRETTVDGAVSADGTVIYWASREPTSTVLYVRINADQPQSKISAGKCTESAKACTYPVSGQVLPAGIAQFWAGAADATEAYFTVGDFAHGLARLYRFDLTTKLVTSPIAGEVAGVLGASSDGSRLYFASNEALPGSGANEFGDSAVAGKPNLYLLEAAEGGGTVRYVGTLTAQDVPSDSAVPNAADPLPIKHASRVSPDGDHLAFMSTASLTGYDNADVSSGKADAEVYLYNSATNRLTCVSCIATNARPSGREVEGGANGLAGLWAAARLATSETQLYSQRVLADDGSWLLFESFDPLVPRDTNSRQDVYEWQASQSEEGCRSLGAELYVPAGGGCISLISSGAGSQDSSFLDATPSASDVFFATEQSLLSQDPGAIDVYDARVNGGFPPPPPPHAECQGEQCQPGTAAPSDQTPSSSTYQGPGSPAGRRCRRGRHKVRVKGKVKCVSKKHRKHAGHKKGSGR